MMEFAGKRSQWGAAVIHNLHSRSLEANASSGAENRVHCSAPDDAPDKRRSIRVESGITLGFDDLVVAPQAFWLSPVPRSGAVAAEPREGVAQPEVATSGLFKL
jgi:hypothetical protein